MKLAVAANGLARREWISLAVAWRKSPAIDATSAEHEGKGSSLAAIGRALRAGIANRVQDVLDRGNSLIR
jgi:hypothetical protein